MDRGEEDGFSGGGVVEFWAPPQSKAISGVMKQFQVTGSQREEKGKV